MHMYCKKFVSILSITVNFCGIPILTVKQADSQTNVHPNVVFGKNTITKSTFRCTFV